MTSSSHTRFSVLINGNLMVVMQQTGDAERTLCTLDMRQQPSFYLSLGHVVCRDAQGREFTLATESDDEADQLLSQLQAVQLRHQTLQTRWGRVPVLAAAALTLAFSAAVAGYWWDLPSSAGFKDAIGAVSTSMPGVRPLTQSMDAPVASAVPPTVAEQPSQANLVVSASSPATAPRSGGDGWTLPDSIRLTLPEKLRNANADARKFFTVEYSSGHARTLYVFADPSCPNCQRVEPLLQAVASEYNVVIFPVAVIGREQSIAAITPVLCMPPELRKAAWAALFDVGHDGLNLGEKKDASGDVDAGAGLQPGKCDLAEKALGINEVAYQAYRIPGTPWVISDDGRHVSQALLNDPAKLQAFLNDKEPANAPE
ncbi:DsbC family protein [Pseudomonas sp. F1002]|uniref:DsbC family protein n=1 Tax=Pseudomonas sp. F1002 TaxID=2738821 RepID=UPI0015A3B57E|nr:DsbC family protein [Pseudomonas sp. F1002]NWB63537.1 DsbC family protein [Pseudomonas sp. F1002]